MNKRYMTMLLIPIILVSSLLGVYAYLSSQEISTIVTIGGFDVLLYDPNEYSNYDGKIPITSMVTFNSYGDHVFGLVISDHNLDPEFITVSISSMPEGGAATCNLIYGTWRSEPISFTLLGDPIPITLDVPLAIDPDWLDWVENSLLWTGSWTSGQDSQNTAVIVLEFDMSGVTSGEWGDIEILVSVELSNS